MKKVTLFVLPLALIIISTLVGKAIKLILICAAVYYFCKLIKNSINWW